MEWIQRRSAVARFIHFIHFLATLTLFYTGLALYHPIFKFLADWVGGFGVTRVAHRAAAIFFIGIPLLAIIFNWRGFVEFMREIFAPWDEDDKEFMRRFIPYLFNAKTKMPPQKKIKSGQRVADWFILGSALLIALSGLVMWLNVYFPKPFVRWMYPIHELSMIVLGVFLLGHAYLGSGLFQPYRGMYRVMFGNGKVTEAEARYHWQKWAEEVKRK
jgi:formate dehydrogenase subunit gamma